MIDQRKRIFAFNVWLFDLLDGDKAFEFIAEIHDHFVRRDLDHVALE